MDERDYKAIQEFDPSQHKYLTVNTDKETGQEYLTSETRGFLGRLWMHFMESSSSLHRVAKYLAKVKISQEDIQFMRKNSVKVEEMRNKLGTYRKNHGFRAEIFDASTVKINIILDSAMAARKKVELEEEQKQLTNVIQAFKIVIPRFKKYLSAGYTGRDMNKVLRDCEEQQKRVQALLDIATIVLQGVSPEHPKKS
jgi:hypothetical protein